MILYKRVLRGLNYYYPRFDIDKEMIRHCNPENKEYIYEGYLRATVKLLELHGMTISMDLLSLKEPDNE